MADEDTTISDALAKARAYTDKLNPLNYLFPSPDPKQIQEAKESGQQLVSDYSDALREANAASSGLVQQGVQNMKSGNPVKMVLGAGQDVLGTVSPVFSPITAGFDVASKRATEAFGEPFGGAVERYGMIADPSHVGWLGKMGHVAMATVPTIKAADKAADIAKATEMAKLNQVQPRKLNPMGLYSAAEERASQLNQTAPVEQLVNTIRNSPGVKTQELVQAGILMPDYEKVFAIREKYQPEIDRLSREYKTSGSEEIKKELMKVQSAKSAEEQSAFVISPEWAGKGKISSKDLAEHFNKSIPDIQKVIYGGRDSNRSTKYGKYVIPGGENYQEVLYTLPKQQMPNFNEQWNQLRTEAEKVKKLLEKVHTDIIAGTLMGGKTPEEMQELNQLNRDLTEKHGDLMSDINYLESKNESYGEKRNYRSSHWTEEPDSVIAHNRRSIREDENGNPILHLEELQSDWGQQGRDKGFAIDPTHLDAIKINARNAKIESEKALEEKGNYYRQHPDLPDPANMKPREYQAALDDFNEKLKETDPKYMELVNNYRNKMSEYNKAHSLYKTAMDEGYTPSGPYVGSSEGWTDFALKQAFRDAAEKGINKIVWTPGQLQADRYNLARHVEQIDYEPWSNLLYARAPNGAGRHYTVKPEDLGEHVGQEIAQRIRDKIQERENSFQVETDKTGEWFYIRKPDGNYYKDAYKNKQVAEDQRKNLIADSYDEDPISLTGLDLEMGGQGMKDYYDKMLYKRMESILKPHGKGHKFGKTNIKKPESSTYGLFSEFYKTKHPEANESEINNAYIAQDYRSEYDKWLRDVKGQDVEVPHIEIPNEMLQSIMTKGFAAHKDGGRIGYATKGSVDPTHGEPTGESASTMMDEADEIMRKLNVLPQSLSGLDMQVVQPGIPTDRGMILPSGGATTAAALRKVQAANSTKPEITYLKDLAAQAGMTPSDYALRFSGIKTSSIPFEEWHYEHSPYMAMQPRKEFDINTLKQGDVIIPLKGDLTSAGQKITNINGIPLATPTKTEGGESYMRWNPDIWASGQSIVSALDNRAKAALEVARKMGYKDPDAYGIHVGMGHHSGDFSTHTADAILGMLPSAKIRKTDEKEFDNFMKKFTNSDFKKQFLDFPGLSSDKLREYLMSAGMGDARIKFAKGMNTSDFLKKGFPDVGPARFATTEPILGGMPANTTGLSIGKFHPTDTISKNPKMPHGSYPVSMLGTYEGRLPVLLDRDTVFNDWSNLYDLKPPTKNYVSAKNKSYDNAGAYQIVTNKYLDMLHRAMEAAKEGKAKGGSVDSDIHDALRIAQEMGRNGDSMIAHINPHEAAILKALGGSGTINPHTGLLQFDNPSMGSYDGAGDVSGNADTTGWGAEGANYGNLTNGGGGGGSDVTSGRDSSPSIGGGNGSDPVTRGVSVSSGQASQDATEKQIQNQIDQAVSQSKQIQSLSPSSDLAKQLGIAAPEAPNAPQAGQSPIGSFNFSNAQMASPDAIGGYTPGGISNYADVPQHPGYVDTGTTAMRLSASDPNNRSVGYYMDKLNKIDPSFQAKAEGVANARLEQGIPTYITPRGGFRTAADQASLVAEKAAGLNPNPVAPVGGSLHQLGKAIDFGGAESPMIDQINQEAGVYTVPNDPGHIQLVPNAPDAIVTAQAKYPSLPDINKFGPTLSQDVANLNEKIALANDWYNTPIIGGIVKNQIESSLGPIQQATPAEEQRIANIVNQANAPAPTVPDDFGTPNSLERYIIERGYVTSGPNRVGSMGSMPEGMTTYNSDLQPTGVDSQFADRSGNIPLPPERPSDFTTMQSSSGQQDYPRNAPSGGQQTAPDGSPVYSLPLRSGQTIRDNFDEAFNDAYTSGARYFYWTNPKTGKTDRYAVSFASGGSVHGNDSVSNALRLAKQIVV